MSSIKYVVAVEPLDEPEPELLPPEELPEPELDDVVPPDELPELLPEYGLVPLELLHPQPAATAAPVRARRETPKSTFCLFTSAPRSYTVRDRDTAPVAKERAHSRSRPQSYRTAGAAW
jgi:hypothetical protein